MSNSVVRPMLALVTSDWVLSYRVWAMVAVLLGSSQVIHNGAQYDVPMTNFLVPAVIAQLTILVVARTTLACLRRVALSRPRKGLVMAFAGILAAGIDSAIFALYRVHVLDLPSAFVERWIGLSILILIWFPIFGAIVALNERERQDIARLTWVRDQMERWAGQRSQSVDELKVRLSEAMESRILADLRRLDAELAQVRSDTTEQSLRHLYEHVQRESTELVRTASRELTTEANYQAENDGASMTGPRHWIAILWRARVAAAWTIALYLVILMAIASVTDTTDALFDLAVVAAILLTGEALWRLADPRRERIIGLVVTWVTYAGVFVAMLTLSTTPFGSGPAFDASSGLGGTFVVSAAVIVSLLVEVARERAETQEHLASEVEQLEEVTADIEGRVGRLRQQISDALHGPVQSRLSAMSMAIRKYLDAMDAGDDPDREELISLMTALIGQAQHDLERVLEPSAPASRSLQSVLEGVSAPWKGLVAIAWEVEPGVQQTLAEDVWATHTLEEVLRDLVTNASRHGRATSVHVLLRQEPGRLIITATDDGKGPARVDPKPGMGSRLILDRGGFWDIRRAPRGGAVVTVMLPVIPALGQAFSG